MVFAEETKLIAQKMGELKQACDALSAKSGAASFEECVARMEEHRTLVEAGDADVSPTKAAKQMMQAQAAKIPRALLAQQAGGYNLLKIVDDGTHGSKDWAELIARLDSMTTAVREVGK